MSIESLASKWFPREPDRGRVLAQLADFYAGNAAYHAMIAETGKDNCPQTAILSCLVRDGGRYADFGCGSGEVAAYLGRRAEVVGVDAAPMAIHRAEERCRGLNVRFIAATGDASGLTESSFDGCYAFELLEHVWDPRAVLLEMARVVRPGGFVFISVPLFMALDLHRNKRPLARLAENACAVVRLVADLLGGCICHHLEPRLEGAVFPDCDVVTSVVPAALVKEVENMGCEIIFWDTTYMCAHRARSKTDLAFQRKNGHPFYRHFGDHLLLLARKGPAASGKG